MLQKSIRFSFEYYRARTIERRAAYANAASASTEPPSSVISKALLSEPAVVGRPGVVVPVFPIVEGSIAATVVPLHGAAVAVL